MAHSGTTCNGILIIASTWARVVFFSLDSVEILRGSKITQHHLMDRQLLCNILSNRMYGVPVQAQYKCTG